MNKENNFSINVAAESTMIGFGDQSYDLTPSEFITIQADTELPELYIIEATEVPSVENIKPDLSNVSGIDFNVKVDSEVAYEKAEMVESGLLNMQKDIKDLYDTTRNSLLRMGNKNEFEERPLTEAVNLIFEHRRDRMSKAPEWS